MKSPLNNDVYSFNTVLPSLGKYFRVTVSHGGGQYFNDNCPYAILTVEKTSKIVVKTSESDRNRRVTYADAVANGK